MKHNSGVTLVELMVAVAILSIGILAMISSFRYITTAIHVSRTQTLATNLAQEQIESLKHYNYYSLLLTTSTSQDTNQNPAITYDNAYYVPQIIVIGGITFTVYTYVSLAEMHSGAVSPVTYTYPDTGLKEIQVSVVWRDRGQERAFSLSNLLENPYVNPLDATIKGQVVSSQSPNPPIASAVVAIAQNPAWSTTADSNGNYAFSVPAGTYTVIASSTGYLGNSYGPAIVSAGNTLSAPAIQLSIIASGTVAGTVWIDSTVLVSQVASTNTTVGNGSQQDIQFVELYNPTTGPINVGSSGAGALLQLNYVDYNLTAHNNISLVYVSTYIPSHGYYLIADATSFYFMGNNVNADAYLSPGPPDYSYPNWIQTNHSGTIQIADQSGNLIDEVGWKLTAGIPSEGTPINTPSGLQDGNQIVRMSNPGGLSSGQGRAYQTYNNIYNFFYFTTSLYAAENTSVSQTPVSGVPAAGAYVFASDPYSGSTQAVSSAGNYSSAPFVLNGISTGSWTIYIATTGFYMEIDSETISQNSTASLGNIFLTSTTTNGFIKGVVTDLNSRPLNQIQVLTGGASGSKTTGSNGAYVDMVSSGSITVSANPNRTSNASYVQGTANPTITSGQITIQDFALSQGGVLMGYMTTGTSPLPNYIVSAQLGGNQAGAGTTGTSGTFYILNLGTGAYTVAPVLSNSQSSNPTSLPATVLSGQTVFVGTFTISGALGTISGHVYHPASALLTSGAVILASSGTLSSSPATIYASSTTSQSPLFAASSQADGSYSLPVTGGYTYNMAIYVPTVASNGSVSTSTQAYSGVTVSAGGTTSKDLTIP